MRGVGPGRACSALAALAVRTALPACVGSPAAPDTGGDPVAPIDVRRVGARVEVRRAAQALRIDVDATGGHVVLNAIAGDRTLAIDAVASGPGVPITATLRAMLAGDDSAELEIRNDLVVDGDVAYRLGEWRERNLVVAQLAAGPIAPALAAVAPYRTAIEAHLAEAAPALVAVGLFQAWPDGVEPAWPALDDPRDLDPPGHLDGDVVGLGMTCSEHIRCPSSAPYCVTVDHAAAFGICTRACASDAACGPSGRCAQPVDDIPDVSGTVLTCELTCADGACPGLLACSPATTVCEVREDSAR
ncbi:MAG TPA: hypothetical protein VFT22_25390 [Kofleriaceae bacterium]|nr:hypothetical protein [Kofleriaceae bacterium]